MHFPRQKSKHCQLDYFQSESLQETNGSGSSITKFKHLDDTLKTVPDTYAPLKKRYVRAKKQNFLGKE